MALRPTQSNVSNLFPVRSSTTSAPGVPGWLLSTPEHVDSLSCPYGFDDAVPSV